MSFWPSQEPPARLKALINRTYRITLKDGRTCAGVFEGYVYKTAYVGAPVHVYLMFALEGEHATLLEAAIAELEEGPTGK